MKKVSLILIAILFVACDKEYYPDGNAYRDSNLYGTWIRLFELNNDDTQTLQVYTEEGYCGDTYKIPNANKYISVDGIWYVEQTNNNLACNRIHSQKRFRNGIYKHKIDYFFHGKDTLFQKNDYDDVSKWDTLIRYKYQLIFDGPDYVGLDSIN